MNVMVLDTETIGNLEKNEDSIVYDIGFTIVDELGNIYDTKSMAISDYFCDAKMMASAYYKEKIPYYIDEITQGTRELITLKQAKEIILDYINKYNIKYISCHNARFDYKALTTTQRYRTCSKYRYFFPKNIVIIDTLKMARKVLKNNNEYNQFCIENNYLTKRNQKRYTAEILYRFVSGDNNFVEKHMGLDDTIIESKILIYLLQFIPIEQGKLWD